MERYPFKLEKPFYYLNPIAIRFEIGGGEKAWWDEARGQYNPLYFDDALKRAMCIFDAVFAERDKIDLVIRHFSDGRSKTSKNHFICRCIHAGKRNRLQRLRTQNENTLQRKQFAIDNVIFAALDKQDMDYRNILKAIINQDFSNRLPAIHQDCYFIHREKMIALHLYDDRGMDMVGERIEALKPFYHQFEDWILQYDKPDIDRLFHCAPFDS